MQYTFSTGRKTKVKASYYSIWDSPVLTLRLRDLEVPISSSWFHTIATGSLVAHFPHGPIGRFISIQSCKLLFWVLVCHHTFFFASSAYTYTFVCGGTNTAVRLGGMRVCTAFRVTDVTPRTEFECWPKRTIYLRSSSIQNSYAILHDCVQLLSWRSFFFHCKEVGSALSSLERCLKLDHGAIFFATFLRNNFAR